MFRPHLLATTSFDGSLATTFKRVAQKVVCDDTHAVALGEMGQRIKVRHPRYSKLKLADAREALAMVQRSPTTSPLRSRDSPRCRWPRATGRASSKRSRRSPRTTGAAGRSRTYTHHDGVIRGVGRAERNMLRAVQGGVEALDRDNGAHPRDFGKVASENGSCVSNSA